MRFGPVYIGVAYIIIFLALGLTLLFSLAGSVSSGKEMLLEEMREAADALEDEVAAGGDSLRDALVRAAEETSDPAAGEAARADAAEEYDGQPAYYHYDPENFYASCGELSELAAGDDAEAVLALYDALYGESLEISTLGAVVYNRFAADVTDEHNAEESVYADSVDQKTSNALSLACRDILEGPCAEEFRAHVGDRAADYFAGYLEIGEREAELLERESELVNEYYAQMDTAYELPYRYGGKDWTLNELSSESGDRLYEMDYDGYFEVYDGLMKSVNELVGPLYVELVGLRAEIAGLEGYDNYADYAYAEIYGRDYTTEDAQAFCDSVKATVSLDYYDLVYYSDAPYINAYGGAMSAEELLDTLSLCAEAVDPLAEEACAYMRERVLYDIGPESCRIDGCYTTSFARTDEPFVFMKLYGGAMDLANLTHEFGHFVNEWKTPSPNLLASVGSYDLFEIHSNGFEVLCLPQYDGVFGESSGAAQFSVLCDQLACVVDGCLYDEFQRRIYAEPDMTLDEINGLYCKLCRAYGEYEADDVDYYWMFISHNYESPLYYISYAASALAALQIWNESRSDYRAAVDTWLDVLDCGAYDEGYLSVLERCGMKNFRDEGAVEGVCTPVLDYLEQMG